MWKKTTLSIGLNVYFKRLILPEIGNEIWYVDAPEIDEPKYYNLNINFAKRIITAKYHLYEVTSFNTDKNVNYILSSGK